MQKFRFNALALTAVAVALFGIGCEKTILPVDSSEKIDYLQGNTEARVIIKLFDVYNSATLAGVKVKIVGLDSAVSDSSGAVFFDSVKAGTYMVICSKSGYESSYDGLSLTLDSNSNTVPVLSQSTDAIYMARRGVAVRGNLYYTNGDTVYPADGAVVEFRLNNTSVTFQNPLVTTTSSNGAYSIGNLPEHSSYTISVRPFSEGSLIYTQESAILCNGNSVGDTIRAEDIVLEKYSDGKFIVMSHNLETFTKTDSLKIDFSEPVDISLLGADSIYVLQGAASPTRILVNLIWRNSNKKLIIVPFDGAWNPGVNYTLYMGEIVSESGKPLDNTEFTAFPFAPVLSGPIGNIQNVHFITGLNDTNKVDWNTASIELIWAKISNASTYQIYEKSSYDSTWALFGSTMDTSTLISTSGAFEDNGILQFLVLGKNSTSISSFGKATILSIKDEIKPRVFPSSYLIEYDFNNLFDSRYSTGFSILSSYLPEPMDTTKVPRITVREGSYTDGSVVYGDPDYSVDPDDCSWEWTSQQTGYLSVTIDPLANGAYDTLKIDFRALTDVAGNKADTTGGAGFITILTRE